MAFIRAKKVYGGTYYYLVESRRVEGRVVQKVLKYLGKQRPAKVAGRKKRKRG